MPVRRVWIKTAPGAATAATSNTTTATLNLCPEVVEALLYGEDLCTHPALRLGAPVTVVGAVAVAATASGRGPSGRQHADLAVHALSVRAADVHAPWLSARLVAAAACPGRDAAGGAVSVTRHD